jgi:hypothetical protein
MCAHAEHVCAGGGWVHVYVHTCVCVSMCVCARNVCVRVCVCVFTSKRVCTSTHLRAKAQRVKKRN